MRTRAGAEAALGVGRVRAIHAPCSSQPQEYCGLGAHRIRQSLTWTKALMIQEISGDERLITIEDAKELVCWIATRTMYACFIRRRMIKALARVTRRSNCWNACLRLKPDRILLAELRAEEAFDYLRNVNSGHPGSITSVHATSADLAFENNFVLLVKQNQGGRELARSDIKSLLYLLVDIVIQFGVDNHERFIKEIWYQPERKRE